MFLERKSGSTYRGAPLPCGAPAFCFVIFSREMNVSERNTKGVEDA
jgi:hypothetical protein